MFDLFPTGSSECLNLRVHSTRRSRAKVKSVSPASLMSTKPGRSRSSYSSIILPTVPTGRVTKRLRWLNDVMARTGEWTVKLRAQNIEVQRYPQTKELVLGN